MMIEKKRKKKKKTPPNHKKHPTKTPHTHNTPTPPPPPPPPITKGTPHLHPKKVHNFRLRTIQNSCISIVDLMPPIPLPPPPFTVLWVTKPHPRIGYHI